MKRLISIILLFLASSQLNADIDPTTCKACHPVIYEEYEKSMHRKSSIDHDPVHKAIWDRHPAKKKDNYKCAKCHTPNATTAKEQEKGITCISCHTIQSVEKHTKANKNIYTDKPKTFFASDSAREGEKIVYEKKEYFFGMFKETKGSPYHDIDYSNQDYYTGNSCMGCHSHKQNSLGFEVCRTDMSGAKDKKKNCITCHMPQVQGSATSIQNSKTHSFHGFAGAYTNPKMLSKYVKLDFDKSDNGFEVTVENQSPHPLMTHPLRVVKLKTELRRDGKSQILKTHTFARILGHNNKPAMPWLADEIFKNNMIKANEKRAVKFDIELKSGDQLEITLGFYVVNPKVVKKLGLDGDKKLTAFTVLKQKYFEVK